MPSAKPVRSEGASTSERIVVVADLHVSAGGGAPLFTADEAFARFVDNLGTRDQPRISALVLAGDFFDFVHATRGRRAWRDTSEEASLGKLELIADAHPLVVRALDDLAASGTRVVVIPGNHDLEFVRPSAQRRLREVLGASQAGTEDAVDFHPWIVYRRGFLYAEHGSQHHDLNAIRTLLVPSALGLERPASIGGPSLPSTASPRSPHWRSSGVLRARPRGRSLRGSRVPRFPARAISSTQPLRSTTCSRAIGRKFPSTSLDTRMSPPTGPFDPVARRHAT